MPAFLPEKRPTKKNYEKIPDALYLHAMKYVMSDGLYIPEYLTKEYKQKLLSDYGLGHAHSYSQLTQKRISIRKIINLLKVYNKEALLKFLCAASNHIARNGSNTIFSDPLQAHIWNHLPKDINDITHYSEDVQNEIKTSTIVTPDTTNALLALGIYLDSDCCGTLDPNNAPANVALSMSGINDYVIGSSIKYKEGSDSFHFENIRDLWFQAPCINIASIYSERFYRFFKISNHVLRHVTPSQKSQLLKYFRSSYRCSFNKYNLYSFALSTCWLGHTANTVPSLFLKPNKSKADQMLLRHIKSISLTSDEYRKNMLMHSIIDHPRTLNSSDLLKLMTRHPFIRLDNNEYLLLSPHLLFRNMELSLSTTFYEKKPREQDPRDLLGPLGTSVEDYVQSIIIDISRKSKGHNVGTIEVPEKRGSGPGDIVILNPYVSLLFEIKNKQPRIELFSPTREASKGFRLWYETSYFSEKGELGAVYQAIRDSVDILNGKLGGIRPSKIIPIVVIPVDVIFNYDFYALMKRRISKWAIYANNRDRILGPLIMGVNDLEYLRGADFGEKNLSLEDIMIEKISQQSATLTSWSTVFDRLDLKSSIPRDVSEYYDKIIKEASSYFGLKKSSVE